MQLTLAERLRCPNAHAPTPMVVVARRTRERELLEGFAGCPVCRLEVPFVDGHVRFEGVVPSDACAGDPPDLDRLIALLGLGEPEGAVLLTGRYAAIAAALGEVTGVNAIVLHATGVRLSSERVSAVLGAPALVPFTDATFRGAALDENTPAAIAADAVRAVAAGGRVVGAAGLAVPAGVNELARDDQEWVAVRVAGGMVELRRGRR